MTNIVGIRLKRHLFPRERPTANTYWNVSLSRVALAFVGTLRNLICSSLLLASLGNSLFGQEHNNTKSAQRTTPLSLDDNVPHTLMEDIIERYKTDLAALERYYNVSFSPFRAERLDRFYRQERDLLAKVPFEALPQNGRIDYLLFKNSLEFSLQQLKHEQEKYKGTSTLLPFAPAIIELEEKQRRMESIDPERVAKTLTDLDKQVTETRKYLEPKLKTGSEKSASSESEGLPSKVVVNRGSRILSELRQTLTRWNEFYSGYDPEFTWWNGDSYAKLDKDLQEYGDFLRKKVLGISDGDDEPVIGDPIGREALIEELEHEMIPYSPEELIEIANKEFAWCEAEQRRAARDLGFGDDWHKALDHVSSLHVKPGEQPGLIRQLGEEATKFVEDHDLVTVPDLCKEIWRMEMMTPERQKVNPYFTGGEVISVSYPTAGMNYDDKLMSMRGNNIHFSRATVQHELIPGHHLQLFMEARYQPHRRVFQTPFVVEGWALYWEMLLWDLGFQRSAEDRVGMLFWRSHRCARIIFSLNFHLGKMTAQEAIDFLVDRVGHERRNATAEVRRSVAGDYGPLYQAAYMLGGLQFRALRKELVDSGKMTNREFHDAILKENAIPVAMIRASITRGSLLKDQTPQWRFY